MVVVVGGGDIGGVGGCDALGAAVLSSLGLAVGRDIRVISLAQLFDTLEGRPVIAPFPFRLSLGHTGGTGGVGFEEDLTLFTATVRGLARDGTQVLHDGFWGAG